LKYSRFGGRENIINFIKSQKFAGAILTIKIARVIKSE
jgi:hypothetical protein